MGEDRGDIIAGFLVRLVLGLGLVGLLAIEVGALAINRVGLDETVDRAAAHGAAAYAEQRSATAAERAARAVLERDGATLVDVEVDGDTVTVTAERGAKVLASHHVDALDELVRPTRTGHADLEGR